MEYREAVAQVDLAEQASAGLDGLDAREWRTRIDDGYAHLEEAGDWLLANDHANDAARLALALEKYFMAAGRLADARVMLTRVLSARGLADAKRTRALFGVGMFAFWQGDDAASRAAIEESLQLARRIGAPDMVALALTGLARLALRAGDITEARSLCRQALDVAVTTTETRGRSSALHVLSVAAQMHGDLNEARDLMWQRLALERAAGSLRLVAAECSNLSAVERQLGNVGAARDLALQALDIETRQEDLWSMSYSFNQLAAIDAQAGEMARAATLLAVAARMVEEQGAGWPPDEAPVFEQTRLACVQSLGEDVFQRASSAGAALSWQEAADLAMSGRSSIRPTP